MTGPRLRILGFSARDFRSLKDLELPADWPAGTQEPLPPVILLYGDNDSGKSNLIQAVGTWLELLRGLAGWGETAVESNGIKLWQEYETHWSGETHEGESDWLQTALGDDPQGLFRYGTDRFELEGSLRIEVSADEAREYQFGLRVSRLWSTQSGIPVIGCRVLTSIWPGGHRANDRASLGRATGIEPLRAALRRPWQRVGAERRFVPEVFSLGGPDNWENPLAPSGDDLKERLVRAWTGSHQDRRRLFQKAFAPLLQEGSFDLTEPRPILGDDGHIELLVGNSPDEHPIEHRGSGPQQWALMAGMLSMSGAGVAAIEEPEAHLSWDAQVRVAKALRELVTDLDRPPFQLFVSTHSILMRTIHTEDEFFDLRIAHRETHVTKSRDTEALEARSAANGALASMRPRWLYPGKLVQLSDKAIDHMGANAGDRLYEMFPEDGSVRLITETRLDEHLCLPEEHEDGKE